jgi:PhzF family phenazine biosynthesis protein
VAGLARALAVETTDLLANPQPRVADTGAGHLMVRARSRDMVDRASPDARALLQCLAGVGAEGCYLYAFDEGAPETAYARFFNPTVGLWEDSATGTAAGPLCAYLASQAMLAASQRLVVEQGKLMGRPSLLTVTMTPDAVLSGSGVVIMRGQLNL